MPSHMQTPEPCGNAEQSASDSQIVGNPVPPVPMPAPPMPGAPPPLVKVHVGDVGRCRRPLLHRVSLVIGSYAGSGQESAPPPTVPPCGAPPEYVPSIPASLPVPKNPEAPPYC